MNHVDLLNYLKDVQKIEKSDLAELIGIPSGKMDDVLSGFVPLKKKWLKNLSLYTGIPEQAIATGAFTLNAPDGEPAPVVKDAYVPEVIREANTRRLDYYVKKRYKNLRDDVVYGHPLSIAGPVLCLIVLVGFAFLFEVAAFSDLVKLMLIGLIPGVMGFSINRASFRFAKKGVPADEKTFKGYTVLAIVQLLIFVISSIAFKWMLPVALVGAIGALLPLIYQIFIQGNNSKVSYIKSLFMFIISALLILGVFFCFIGGEKLETAESQIQHLSLCIIFSCGWFSVLLSTFSVLISHTYFCKRNGISKHFGPVVKKPAFKSGRFAKSIISLVLAVAILFGGLYVAPVILLDSMMSSAATWSGEEPTETEYVDYECTDILFAEDEQLITIEKDFYTIQVPAYLQKREDAKLNESYMNQEKLTSFIINTTYVDYADSLFADGETESEKKYKERLRSRVAEKYGFVPQSEYEYYKLMRLISEDTISPFDRELSIVASTLKGMQQLMGDEKVYFYEDSEKCFCIRANFFERDDGSMSCFYNIEGNATGDYDKRFSFTVMVVEQEAHSDLPFCIVNSMEIK